MKKGFEFWGDFWSSLPAIRNCLAPNAARSGISADAAILLIVVYEFPLIEFPVNYDISEELSTKGLIEMVNGNLKITSKGSILAKSFQGQLKANF